MKSRSILSWHRWWIVGLAGAAITTALLAFSLTAAWNVDESFHLVAAQLVSAGERPYLDFFHQHPPLYAYLAAGWMQVFGQSWRSAHALSTLLTGCCILLVAGYVFNRLKGTGWETFGSLAAALFLGLHSLVVREATVAHPFSLTLVLSTAAFRLAVAGRPFWAGLATGGALTSSLLALPLGPVLWLWLLYYAPSGQRRRRGIRFLLGTAVPFLPLLWLAVQDPHRVWFNLVEYHLVHRQYVMKGPVEIPNWEVLRWLPASSQGLLLLTMGAAGLIFALREQWPRRSESYLCGWLVVAWLPFLASTRPSFFEYLVLLTPPLCVLAALGVSALGAVIRVPLRPALLLVSVVALYVWGPVRWAWRNPDATFFRWQRIEELVHQVDRVTPPGGRLYAPEFVYFIRDSLPPRGLNNRWGRYVRVEPDRAARLNVVLESELNGWVQQGRFDTVVAWTGLAPPGDWPRLYRRRMRVDHWLIFWDRVPVPAL